MDDRYKGCSDGSSRKPLINREPAREKLEIRHPLVILNGTLSLDRVDFPVNNVPGNRPYYYLTAKFTTEGAKSGTAHESFMFDPFNSGRKYKSGRAELRVFTNPDDAGSLLVAVLPENGAGTAAGAKETGVVFKKGTPPETAKELLKALGYSFREGGDSSRGKQYFYDTGPKFLVAAGVDGTEKLKRELSGKPEVFEIYEADNSVQKD